MGREQQVALIARALLTSCPPGWRSAQVVCRRVGRRAEHRAQVWLGGDVIELPLPPPVPALFEALRSEPPLWFSARVRLAPPDRFTLDTDDAEPDMTPPPDRSEVLADPALALASELPRWVLAAREVARTQSRLREALTATGLGPGAIVIVEAPGPGWRVARRGEGWVAQHDGADAGPVLTDVADAAALALGRALFEVVRARGEIAPRAQDPPLSLLTQVRRVILGVGTELDRVGENSGAMVWAARTPWELRSLPEDHAARPRAAYVVRRPIEVLAGVAVPWFGRPGGGRAFVLPDTVASLLVRGALAPAF